MIRPLLNLAAALLKPPAEGPCDIYARGGTPCVAAHSTVRCLFSDFEDALYELKRLSDHRTADVYPLAPGGVANAATQDEFCKRTTCLISTIYDQSGRGNHLTAAPPGGAQRGPEKGGYDSVAGANGAAVSVNGHRAYGVFTTPASGYRNDNTSGVATGNDPEGMYAIFDGTHFNDDCCYDYGNAETDNLDDDEGTMETLYFGAAGWNRAVHGTGHGPWIQADLENGLWAGGPAYQDTQINPNSPSITDRFVTAILKGNDTNYWAIRGGNAQGGSLADHYKGPRPSRPEGKPQYYPMRKQGAIILGIGGDNSIRARGTFYEGAMTTGFPTDETEDAVQANIVAAGYATTQQTSGPPVSQGQIVSFSNAGSMSSVSFGSDGNELVATSRPATSFKVVSPLAPHSGCMSFQSTAKSGCFVRHHNFQLYCDPRDSTRSPDTFNDDATFCPEVGFTSDKVNAVRSYSYPSRYWRQTSDGRMVISQQGGPYPEDIWENFSEEASWAISAKWTN